MNFHLPLSGVRKIWRRGGAWLKNCRPSNPCVHLRVDLKVNRERFSDNGRIAAVGFEPTTCRTHRDDNCHSQMLPTALLLSCPASTGSESPGFERFRGIKKKRVAISRIGYWGKTCPQSITGQWALRPNLNNLRAGCGALGVTNLISNVMDMSRDVENLYVSPVICYGLKPMPILVNVE